MFCLASLCCVCLSRVKKSTGIIYTNDTEQLKRRVQFCFPDVDFNDMLQSICNACNERLDKCYEFKYLYLNSRTRLTNYLSNLSNENCKKNGQLSLILQDVCKHKDPENMENFEQIRVKKETFSNESDVFLEPNRVNSFESFTFNDETISGDCGLLDMKKQNQSTFFDNVYRRNEQTEFSELHKRQFFGERQSTQIVPEIASTDESFPRDPLEIVSAREEDLNFTKTDRKAEQGESSMKNMNVEKTVVECDSLHVSTQSRDNLMIKEERIDSIEDNQTLDCNTHEITKTENVYVFIKEEPHESNMEYEYEGCSDVDYNSLHVGMQQSGKSAVEKDDGVSIEDNQAVGCYSEIGTNSETALGFVKENETGSVNDGGITNFCAESEKNVNLYSQKDTFCNKTLYLSDKCTYKCSNTSRKLNQHRIYTEEKPFSCVVCSYKCDTFQDLKVHNRIHTGEKPFSCDICSYKCSRSGDLKKHKRIHTGEKPYFCDMCSYQCHVSSALIRHKRIHTGEKPFSCDLCNYKCNQPGTLTQHKRVHSGERPFVCNICNYKCKQPGTLKQHKRLHVDGKPFACDECTYKCNSPSRLRRHKMIHTGEKLFSCDLCNYSCNLLSYLKKHKRIHKDEQSLS